MDTTKQKTAATIARAAAPPLHVQRAAASVRPPSVRVSAPVVQPSLRVSSPSDPAEKEAESTARSVMRISIPDRAVGYVRTAAGGVFRQIKGKKEDEERDKLKLGPKPLKVARLGLPGEIQRKAEGMPNLKANVAAEIQSASAGGNPLPLTVRRFMEPRFKADFSAVKVHTGDRAAKLNQQLNAKAFAVGKNVFFGKDQFKPETDEGRELIAHELTHTIQQGAATQARRSEDVTVTQTAPVQVQRLGMSDALDYFADKANLIPGYRMFTIVLGVNPVNMSRVDRSPANIMRAIVEFIPGGGLITQALDNYGVFDKVGAWVEQQLRSLGMSGAAFKAAIMEFLGTLGWRDIFDLGGVWDRAKRILGEPVDRLISFAGGLITGILGLIKDAILRPIAALAQGTRGYDLLKAILGRDPITGDSVPRNAETLIGGFMKLIGQEEVWENIKKGNAIPRAWAWFQGALSGLMSQVEAVPGKFMAAITSLTLADIVLLPRAFAKVGGVFLDIIGGFFSWAGAQVMALLEIVFDVVSPGAMGYIKRVGGSLMSILRNPLPFVGNLVKAAKLGFQNFASRFGSHLRDGLIRWLTGSLPGIYIPTAFTLPELVKFVFSALGLTWANVRAKLVKAVGETAVKAMETGFDIVMTLVTQGPAAAWDKIKEQLGNLRDTVVGGITNMVVEAVVTKAVPKLVAMFIPGAGFITAIISIYDTVMVFVRQISRIIEVVNGFINSIVAIASGNIAAAATKVEGVLAGLLSLAINFLAGFAGLGRVSDKVMVIFNRLRAPIDRALDALVGWIVGMARRVGRLAVSGAQGVVARVAAWWSLRKQFRAANGESHTIYYQGEGERAVLMMATTPIPYMTFVNSLTSSNKGAMEKIARQMDTVQGHPTMPPAEKQQVLDNKLNSLARATGEALTAAGPGANRYPGSGLDPMARSNPELWLDLTPDPMVGARESGADIALRRIMARGVLMLRYTDGRSVAEAIHAFNLGRDIQPFDVVRNESGDAHVIDRHVLNGAGMIKDMPTLALRVLLDDPTTGGHWKASAFRTVADAQSAIAGVITRRIAAVGGWPVFREQLIANSGVNVLGGGFAASAATTLLANPLGRVIAMSSLPPYVEGVTLDQVTVAGAAGTRPLYPGDTTGGLSGVPLTAPASFAGTIYVALIPNGRKPGGWFIVTSYPE